MHVNTEIDGYIIRRRLEESFIESDLNTFPYVIRNTRPEQKSHR